MRDVAEHIDDYAIDQGRDDSVGRFLLEVFSISEDEDGVMLDRLGHQLNADKALLASRKLFDVLRNTQLNVPVDATEPRR
jgi:hypothetical protein